MTDVILKLAQVKSTCGLGKSAIYQAVKRGEFPPPVRLSMRAVGWRASDIDRWMQSRLPSINASCKGDEA